MKNHTVWEHAHLWLKNWKYRRLLPIRFARDPFSRNVDWRDLPFVSFSCLPLVISSLWRKEKVSGVVILIGSPFTMTQWDDTCEWVERLINKYSARNTTPGGCDK